MLASALMAALLVQAAPADPLVASFAGWYTEVEDDVAPENNSPVRGVATEGCTTRITGERHVWAVDWRAARTVALEDVFVFIDAPPLKFAVVADVRDAAGQAKLRGMRDAMAALATRCAPK